LADQKEFKAVFMIYPSQFGTGLLLTRRFVLVLVVVLPTSPRRLKLPTSLRRSKLRKAISDKPGGYVGQAVLGSGGAE
jgi:hypothetical protein